MIWLVDSGNEHPLWTNDNGYTELCLVFEAKEVANLGVAVLETFCCHLARSDFKNTMRKLILWNNSNLLTISSLFSFSWVIHFKSSKSASFHTFVSLFNKVDSIGDHRI